MFLCAPLCLRFWDPMDCAYKVPLSMRFPRKGHWSVWPFLLSRDLAGDPHPRIEPTSPRSPTLAAGFFTREPPENPVRNVEEIKMVSGCHGLQSRGYEYHEFRRMKSSCETVVMDTSYYTFAQTLEWSPLEEKHKLKLETLFHVFLDPSLVTNVNTGGEKSRKTVHIWEKYVHGISLYLTLNSALKLNNLRYWY